MTPKFFACSLLSLAILTACSSVEDREIASGGFSYLKNEVGQQIKIPADIDTPDFNDSFKLPNLGPEAPRDFIGERLSCFALSHWFACRRRLEISNGLV